MKLMSNFQDLKILKEIEIDRNHIDNYSLETDEGTKRTKEKFHKNAVTQRNVYVNKQHSLFLKYKVEVENEIVQRLKKMIPNDKTKKYDALQQNVDQLARLVRLDSVATDSFKLKLNYIVSAIGSETSLEDLNQLIIKFIVEFKNLGITLTVEDFKYTMFTEMYMESFFEDNDYGVMKETFERIYFACPDIRLQLKMNLNYILDQYQKELATCVEKLKKKEFEDMNVTSSNVIEKYISYRNDLGNKKVTDEYYNTMIFLKENRRINDFLVGAPSRVKNYDLFAVNGKYDELDDNAKNCYNSAMMDFYLTLKELKRYYKYEFIIKELFKRYQDRATAKGQYESKKKELLKEEKMRVTIYHEYQKACGIGFLAKKNDVKKNNAKLKMNEHVKKLNALYDEVRNLEITNHLNQLNDSSSIYDLLLVSFSSFDFLEKQFLKNEEFLDKSLEDNIDDYFQFIYSPDNAFLRKINVFVNFDITDILANKYKLLDLNINKEMISKDTIDETMNSAMFINLIQNIERSHISIEEIKLIYDMSKVVSFKYENTELI